MFQYIRQPIFKIRVKPSLFDMKRTVFIVILFLSFRSFAQEGILAKTDLFTITYDSLVAPGNFVFRIAVDAEEVIAFNSCNAPYVFLLNQKGEILEKIKLPYEGCLRNMEFDEFDNLMMMDNEEKTIYKYVRRTKKIETLPYTKPEDWYKSLNHFYRFFEISSIPTFYNNPDYIQDFYYTRFPYSYNLWLNYNDGYIYQFAYNFVRKIGNRKTYIALKRSDIWFSERLTNKCKPLLINLEKETAVYYDRSLNLILEDFAQHKLDIYQCAEGHDEAVQLDFATNMKQQKVWGVSQFSKKEITFSLWEVK